MKCPLPYYWMCHIVIALLIAVTLWPVLGIAAGLTGGAMFYVGREFTQWQQGGGKGLPLDWPGFLAPMIVCVALIVVYFVWH